MRPLLTLSTLFLLAACSVVEAPTQVRGNRVDAELLSELVPGTSRRADVAALLGSPSVKAAFDDNTWMYVSEVTQTRVGRAPGIREQEVVVLEFDQAGVLRDVRRLGLDDGKDVQVVGRATPSPGSDASFLQQLLGNVGRFSTGPGTGVPGGGSARRPGGSGADGGL